MTRTRTSTEIKIKDTEIIINRTEDEEMDTRIIEGADEITIMEMTEITIMEMPILLR
jgi:hypothetical protein